jgi:VanZ family protein
MPIEMVKNKNRTVLGIINLAVFTAIIIAGLWPFDFWPTNEVRWLPDENGIQFYGRAMLFSRFPSSDPIQLSALEIQIQPDDEPANRVTRIFSAYDQRSELFFIGQTRNQLVVRKTIRSDRGERYQGRYLRDTLKRGEKCFLTITAQSKETSIYIDGVLVKRYPGFDLFSEMKRAAGHLILGNSPEGDDYWRGNLSFLAIYHHPLTREEILQHFQDRSENREPLVEKTEYNSAVYLFGERSGHLARAQDQRHEFIIPSVFKFFPRILVPPWEDFRFSRSYIGDMVTNIFGFMPFGFLFSAYLMIGKPRSRYAVFLLSIGIAALIGFSIELLQVYLLTRHSQLMDVLTNTLGAALGSLIFLKFKIVQNWVI